MFRHFAIAISAISLAAATLALSLIFSLMAAFAIFQLSIASCALFIADLDAIEIDTITPPAISR
jgi:hypothetical protein